MPDHSLSRLNLFSQYRGPLAYNMAEGDPPEPPKGDEGKDPPKDTPKDPPKPNDHEGRISELVNTTKELKKQLKSYEDKEKAREEEEAKNRGEHEKLAEKYKGESAAEKTAREAAEAKATKYEEMMQAQINRSLESVKDEEKRKSVEALLAGLSVEAQFEKLPEVLKLVGSSTGNTGTPTPPGTPTPGKADIDQKQARYAELLAKGSLTPPEQVEKNRLMFELSEQWKKGKQS